MAWPLALVADEAIEPVRGLSMGEPLQFRNGDQLPLPGDSLLKVNAHWRARTPPLPVRSRLNRNLERRHPCRLLEKSGSTFFL